MARREADVRTELDELNRKMENIQQKIFDQESERLLFDLYENIKEKNERLGRLKGKLSKGVQSKLENKEKLTKFEKIRYFRTLRKLKKKQREIEPLLEETRDEIGKLILNLRQEINRLDLELAEIESEKPENKKKAREAYEKPENLIKFAGKFLEMIISAKNQGDVKAFIEETEKFKEAMESADPSLKEGVVAILQKQLQENEKRLDGAAYYSIDADIEMAKGDLDMALQTKNAKLIKQNEDVLKKFEEEKENRVLFKKFAIDAVRQIQSASASRRSMKVEEKIDVPVLDKKRVARPENRVTQLRSLFEEQSKQHHQAKKEEGKGNKGKKGPSVRLTVR